MAQTSVGHLRRGVPITATKRPFRRARRPRVADEEERRIDSRVHAAGQHHRQKNKLRVILLKKRNKRKKEHEIQNKQ